MRDCKHCNYSLETACPFDLKGECPPINNIGEKETCGEGDCDDCVYLDGDCCRLIYEEKEYKE